MKESKLELTGGRSGARGLGNRLNGGGGVDGAGIQSEVGEMRKERGVLEVNLDKATACGPLGGVEDAGVHAHGLLAQVREPMLFIVLEHPDHHVVHVHAAPHHKNHAPHQSLLLRIIQQGRQDAKPDPVSYTSPCYHKQLIPSNQHLIRHIFKH